MSSKLDKLLGGAKVVLGAAFVAEGIRIVIAPDSPAALGRAAPAALPARGGVIRRVETHTLPEGRIDERINFLVEGIRSDSIEPRAREIASRILSRRKYENGRVEWAVAPKDYASEVTEVFEAMRDPANDFAIRYTHDHLTVDQFASTRVSTTHGIGDCDCMMRALGSVLRAIGYPVRIRVVQTRDARSWSHVYLMAGLPPDAPTRWMALDMSEARPAGWEVSKSHVARKRDYDV